MAITVGLNQLQKLQLGATSPFGTTDFIQVAQLTFDNSYPNGGYPITASAFNLSSVLGMTQIGTSAAATPTLSLYDKTNGTLRVYIATVTGTGQLSATQSTFAEVSVGAAFLNGVSPTYLIIGV